MLVPYQDVVDSFRSLPGDAVVLDFLKGYTFRDEPIFVCPRTGILSTRRGMSAKEIVSYWSNNIFKSVDPDDYSALNPFAQARLLYTLLTLASFVEQNPIAEPRLCDFATGQGLLLELASKYVPHWQLSATEDSEELVKNLATRGFRVISSSLGIASAALADHLGSAPNLATICWTLCNCIDPLSVLAEIHTILDDSGYLCVAEGSRILVPFRKSLADMFSRVHPTDIHPFYFSRASISALLRASGFEPVYCNRYFDSDVLVVIARKRSLSGHPQHIEVDDPAAVVSFMRNWAQASAYFETELRPKLPVAG